MKLNIFIVRYLRLQEFNISDFLFISLKGNIQNNKCVCVCVCLSYKLCDFLNEF